MSFKRMSKRLKHGLTHGLGRLSTKENMDQGEKDEETPKKKTTWNVLITGGAGHLAEHLVLKLVEHVKDEIRPEVVTKLEAEMEGSENVPESGTGKRFRKNQLLVKINHEIDVQLPTHIQIVLVDMIAPNSKLLNSYTTFIQGSFDDEFAMKTALEDVDTVFHLAAVGMTGQYAHDRKACMDINSVGTMNLLSWARHAGVQRFIYTSSIGVVFDGTPLHDVDESVAYPEFWYNFYCESKAHAELIVRKASCEEMKTTVLRFNGIYGPGEKRVTERVVNFMISGWWIAICKPNGVEALTQLSSVENCVQGLVKAELALRPADSIHAQVYNIMDKNPVGTFSFWAPLNTALGFTDHMYNIPAQILRPCAFASQAIANFLKIDPLVSLLEIDLLLVNNTFNLSKAQRDLGYEPYPDSMNDIVEMYRQNFTSLSFKNQRQQTFYMRVTLLTIIFFAVCTVLFFISKFLASCFLSIFP